MNNDKKEYVELLRKEFYSNSRIDDCPNCKDAIKQTKFNDLLVGFISGKNKLMCVMDLESNERYEY